MAKALFLEVSAGQSKTVLYDTAAAKSDVLATCSIGGVTYTLYRGKNGGANPRYFLYSDPALGGKSFQLLDVAGAVEFYGAADTTQSMTPANAFTPIPTVDA